jgi:hypothetical protein
MVEGGMDIEVLAWTIIFGELEGGKFDWAKMDWEKPGGA